MTSFCLNDCVPLSDNKYIGLECFENTIREYSVLTNKFRGEITGILTSNTPDDILISDGYTLANCLSDLSKEYQRIAYPAFNKYPVDNYFESVDEEALVQNDYIINVGDNSYNAINAAITATNKGVLFTLASHDDLKRNTLLVNVSNGSTASVNSLYGEPNNTDFIKKIIQDEINEKLDSLERIALLLENCKMSQRFKKSFNQNTKQIQESIFSHFKAAIDRNGNTKLFADGQLIKDVTPDKETEIKLFELRVFSPVAFRVYFYETAETIYLGMIEKKPADKVQSGHITTASNLVKELLIVEGDISGLP